MSTTAISFITTPNCFTNKTYNYYFKNRQAKPNTLSLSSLIQHQFLFKVNYLVKRSHLSPTSKKIPSFTGSRPFSSPVMEWQDCTVKMEIDVPASVAYNCYSDREAIPKWMPFISSVQAGVIQSRLENVLVEGKPDLSRWSLKYEAFGQDIEFSWLARNMQPIPNQKIHWRSLEGLPNRGVVRFFPKGPSSCTVELTVSYEVPPILIPVASALQPFLERLLRGGLERFSKIAKAY